MEQGEGVLRELAWEVRPETLGGGSVEALDEGRAGFQ